MSRQQVRGNPRMRKGLGSRTSDPATMMEDPPSGDWLTLRSDQFLNWVDDAVYNIAEKTGIRDVVNRVTRPIFNWGLRYSPWPLHLGIMCCALEMGAAGGPRLRAHGSGLPLLATPVRYSDCKWPGLRETAPQAEDIIRADGRPEVGHRDG